jgi:hypothetical protein
MLDVGVQGGELVKVHGSLHLVSDFDEVLLTVEEHATCGGRGTVDGVQHVELRTGTVVAERGGRVTAVSQEVGNVSLRCGGKVKGDDAAGLDVVDDRHDFS